jgi:hypothetical protein
MLEINLEEFEQFYKEKLELIFFREKRVVKKSMSDIKDSLIEIKMCMDHFIETGEGKIEDKAQRSLHFFSDRIRKEINDIQIPEEDMNHDNILSLLNSIKRLFTSINEIARKSIPRFQKEVQNEIKELNYITRKLHKKQGVLDNFMHKKYNNLRDAEYLLKRLDKLFSLRDNIESAKKDIDVFEKDLNERIEIQQNLNHQLLELEKNDLFTQLDKKKDELFKLRIKVNDQLGFKKALKKLRFELEKGNIHISNFDTSYLRDFLKDSINTLAFETSDLGKFSALLVQLRHILEENKLNMKSDTRDKTVQQINAIFDEKAIYDDIAKLRTILGEIKTLEKSVEDSGLTAKKDDLKNQISSNTIKLEHIESDLDRKNKDYLRYLASLKTEREDFQKQVSEILGDDIKVTITFSF